MKHRKLFTGLLSAALTAALIAGCGSTAQSPTAGGDETVQAAGGDAQEAGERSMEPVTLTLGINALDEGEWTGGIADKIREELGITIQVVKVDNEKVKVLAAGGDLPDMLILPELYMQDVQNMISAGQFAPLDELLEKYGQNIMKNEPVAMRYSKEVVGNGTTYIIPCAVKKADMNTPLKNGFVGFFSRYDFYKAVGSPEINGEDDYLEALRLMQDYAQSQRTDGKKVYALSGWTDWGLWPYTIAYPFSHGYTNLAGNFTGKDDTGEVESQFLDEDGVFWRGLKFMNKAHRMGLYDPEALTQKWEQYVDKVKNGTLLTQILMPPDHSTAAADNAVMTLLPGAFPVLPDIYNYDLACGYQVNDSRAISANCKYPERAMQFMNYLDSDEGARLIMNGVQGRDWDYVDGVPQIIGERLAAFENGTNSDYDLDHGGIAQLQYFYSGACQPADGYPVNLQESEDWIVSHLSDGEKMFAQDYGCEYPGKVYDQWIKDGLATTQSSVAVSLQIIGPCSDENAQIQSNADQYMNANIAKVILAESDEEFASAKAAIISDLKAMGADTADEEFRQNAEEARALAASFAE
ncbi:extracellular solute-binding protein [Lachnoclostridium sp. Marseille-P6806]|uniref:extracellular solute-binding protein n=1 Tax=Lachnoclostridium sp. Marseille-P6806 TaxID=2364793 RepID=UPI0013EF19EC|nr:extracellular solute-binding protein [Lachnoclostridium sp. Marseille-P6806]